MAKLILDSTASLNPSVLMAKIKSNDGKKTIDLKDGFVTLQYGEHLFGDSVDIAFAYSDTGVRGLSVSEDLPIYRTEDIRFKFADGTGLVLDVSLNVDKIEKISSNTTNSNVMLHCVSEELMRNELVDANVEIRYDGRVSDSIRKICKDNLKTTKKLFIEESANNFNFLGNGHKSLYTLNWLSKHAIPSRDGKTGDSAGCLFYENYNGVYFKSIDGLFAQKPVKKFTFTNNPKFNTVEFDGAILRMDEDKQANALSQLRIGAYDTKLVTFDPRTRQYVEIEDKAESSVKGTTTAGKNLPILNEKFKSESSRKTFMMTDTGSMPTGDTKEQVAKNNKKNFDVENVLNQAIRRYNQILSQQISITIAGDFSLHVGDTISISKPSLDESRGGNVDKFTSGKYLITDLCHYLTPTEVFTKLSLARDTFNRKSERRDTLTK